MPGLVEPALCQGSSRPSAESRLSAHGRPVPGLDAASWLRARTHSQRNRPVPGHGIRAPCPHWLEARLRSSPLLLNLFPWPFAGIERRSTKSAPRLRTLSPKREPRITPTSKCPAHRTKDGFDSSLLSPDVSSSSSSSSRAVFFSTAASTISYPSPFSSSTYPQGWMRSVTRPHPPRPPPARTAAPPDSKLQLLL